MKVLNVSEYDWANFAYDNMMSLRSVGINCHSFILKSHPFKYKHTSKKVSVQQMEKAMEGADVVQAFHSPLSLVPILKRCGKPVIVYHAGSTFRREPLKIHRAFEFTDLTVCALPELYLGSKRLGADPVYIVGGIHIPEKISFSSSGRLKIAHHPSNAKVKGTEILRPLLSKYKARITTDRVPYDVQLQRLSECDVYVEMMADKQEGNPYGSFGITALEATARGKIVITNCTHSEVYREHYGQEPFIFCNDLDSLKLELDSLVNSDQIEILKRQLHERFRNLHSYTSTGKYLLSNVLSKLL